MPTRRQQIIELLAEGPITARLLSETLGVPMADIIEDLGHVQRSLGTGLVVTPSSCNDCGFRMTKRQRFTAPSRCPRCRSEHTTDPELRLNPRCT